jgi:hypothetical protein
MGTDQDRRLTLPDILLIASTRGMLGAGIGLLLAGRLSDDQRRAVGCTLLLVGAVTTIPLAMRVMQSQRAQAMLTA